MYDLEQFPLPYNVAALAPYISVTTMEYHHGKHLATYIKNLNDLIAGTRYENIPLMEIIKTADGAIFNNAAQIFNHDFFFHCLTGGATRTVPDEIAAAFGGADKFRAEFKRAATGLFGSGWVWLAKTKEGTPEIITTQNADTPARHGLVPLLTLDVWEHAYYLDYQNRRAEYIDAFLDHLVNWDFVVENLRFA